MTLEQKQVKQFMQLMEQDTPSKPNVPSEQIRVLRAKLIYEEAMETIQALGVSIHFDFQDDEGVPQFKAEFACDLELVADGLADLHYVAYCGTAVALGIDMEPVFAEVHRSNMTKLWSFDELDCLGALDLASLQWSDKGNGRYLVKRLDGKVIKSKSYSKAEIRPILLRQ